MLRILDPVQDARTQHVEPPARPRSLAGKVLGLYSNGKLNASPLLQMIADELRRTEGDFTIRTGRYHPQDQMAEAEWEDVDACDVVILANGDCGACSSSGIANAIALEKRGVPAFLISTPPFTEAVRTMARLNGMPDISWGIVQHPIGSAGEPDLRERAKVAAAQFREAMLAEAAVHDRADALAVGG